LLLGLVGVAMKLAVSVFEKVFVINHMFSCILVHY
jgi:hypothetical protein